MEEERLQNNILVWEKYYDDMWKMYQIVTKINQNIRQNFAITNQVKTTEVHILHSHLTNSYFAIAQSKYSGVLL